MMLDLTGRMFGHLTVIRRGPNNKFSKAVWWCRCVCGTEKLTAGRILVKGEAKSCGCKRYTERKMKHGLSRSREFSCWHSMVNRCRNPKASGYNDYGGRGILVCERWERSFKNFIADMGMAPSNTHSLDRIDVNGNYEKSNCRWATPKEQAENRRDNVVVIFHGAPTKLVALYNRSPRNVSLNIARDRIRNGWPINHALSLPKGASRPCQ